jgi:threonine dehydrogenase-like Zn-dependent dehydrogenase
MRATVMYGAGDVRIENVPDPSIVEPTDAVIRVVLACICGSDLWPYKNLEPDDGSRVMGHEAIGVVEDVGADVRTVKAGDVVVMPFAFSDGTCLFCEDGLQTECSTAASSATQRYQERNRRPSASHKPMARSTSSRLARTTR